MIKTRRILLLFASILFSAASYADSSFRLSNGKLLSTGMSIAEVKYMVGQPLDQTTETIAVDDGSGEKPIKRETLVYELKSSIGGKRLVVINAENGTVVNIETQQKSRI